MSKPRQNFTIDLYQEVLGDSPAKLVKKEHRITTAQLSKLMAKYATFPPEDAAPSYDHAEIWPLVSHHIHGRQGLFGADSHSLLPRTLTMLFIHDGLVVADPLQDVLREWMNGRHENALRAAQRATSELAQVETLLTRGILRLTRLRPALQNEHRAAVLKAMGLTPDLRVFTDFAEYAVSLPDYPLAQQQLYLAKLHELFLRFGLVLPPVRNHNEASERVKALAAAVVEVSWQFAVVANDPWCDLAPRGFIERHLSECLIAQGLDGDLKPGHHIDRLELGQVPNLDPTSLSIADAVAIRNSDTFESFRDSVHAGLDIFEAEQSSGKKQDIAAAYFTERMQNAAVRLQVNASRSTFKKAIISGTMSVGIGIVPNLTGLNADPTIDLVSGGAASLLELLAVWLYSRHQPAGDRVAQRYLAMLGSNSPMGLKRL